MASGIWTSVSGAAAQAQNVDLIANNLANADTLGFKKDLPSFSEYLATKEREHLNVDIPRGQFKNRDMYPLDTKDQGFVVVDGTYTVFKQGNLRVTQSPLDIAFDGVGFLEVSTPTGPRYTRQGSLHVAADGRLMTSDGNPVLATAAAPGALTPTTPPALDAQGRVLANTANPSDAARVINLRDRTGPISINEQGELYVGDELVAKLSVVEFTDTRKLRKAGSQNFENPDPANVIRNAAKTTVRQGVLETSNVNPVEEMTNLIKANRLFEHDMKALKTYGDLMQREANDIGKL